MTESRLPDCEHRQLRYESSVYRNYCGDAWYVRSCLEELWTNIREIDVPRAVVLCIGVQPEFIF